MVGMIAPQSGPRSLSYHAQDQVTINNEKASADEALAAAIPALEAAARALENLDKKDITEIKAFMTPPKPVMDVCMCVVVLRPLGKENEADGWNGAKAMLNDVNFLKSLIEYPKDNISGESRLLLRHKQSS